MAKRLFVTLDDGTETWIELSGVLTRRVESRVWEEQEVPMEAAQEVLAEAGFALAPADE